MARARSKPAFTLVELIVVILLISVMAGLVLPRLLSRGGREARAEAESLAGLMGAAARRAMLTTQRVALDYSDGTMQLMVLRARNPESFATGNLQWTPDLLTQPVALQHLTLASATRDGNRLETRRFRIELGHDLRPQVLLTVQSEERRSWTIWMAPEIDGAMLLDSSDGQQQLPTSVVDLDRSGRGLSGW